MSAWGERRDAPMTTPRPRRRTTLDDVHDTFRRWLGAEFDLAALDVVLATAAVERLDGDPAWLLVMSGAGNAKTEIVSALAGAGAHVTSTITSEGALLSATSKKETGKDATGGLLRKIGDEGTVVIKDFTSILSMGREIRGSVLAALREVFDGRWERNVGTDGGRTLTWTGRVVLVGAVTSAYDSAHGVIAAMGDRFALVRVDSTRGRVAAGRQALGNVGSEVLMRSELAAAVGALFDDLDLDRAELTDDANAALLLVADLVTYARTAVERDNRGEVVDAHAPEAPTRFVKMLGQIVRGGLVIGASAEDALAGALRVARDSMPPLRRLALLDVAEHPGATLADVRRRLDKPRTTVDRVLQELHVLGLLTQHDGMAGSGWTYRPSDLVSAEALELLAETRDRPRVPGNVTTPTHEHRERARVSPDVSGHSATASTSGAQWQEPPPLPDHLRPHERDHDRRGVPHTAA